MKILIIVLIIMSFLQTTIFPIDFVLLILICRAYVKSDSKNLYLAFYFGILTSHLGLAGIGLQSLIYMCLVEATEILSRFRLAGNPLLIVPLAFICLTISKFANSILISSGYDFFRMIIISFLALPVLFLVKLWEERFVVPKEIKLKMK